MVNRFMKTLHHNLSRIQLALSNQVISVDDFESFHIDECIKDLHYVAGMDITSYKEDYHYGVASLVILSFPELDVNKLVY
jgi:deoxyinosine 3'endonuclease (endonuclease V)